MTSQHYLFAAERIIKGMEKHNLGVASIVHFELFKEYVEFFREFSPGFCPEKFERFIHKKIQDHTIK